MTDAPARPDPWRTASVREVAHDVPGGVRLVLDVPGWEGHLAGQHCVLRLRAPDGYTAQRSYSIASVAAGAASRAPIELCVARLADGEVSTFLADEVVAGDRIEVRGPIGGWFTWDGEAPALAIGGGYGVVPVVAMARTAVALGRPARLRVLAVARRTADLPYAAELAACGATLLATREDGPDGRPPGRLGPADVAAALEGWAPARVLVCGPTGFAEAAGQLLVGAGVAAGRIRIERFGPSG